MKVPSVLSFLMVKSVSNLWQRTKHIVLQEFYLFLTLA